MRRILAVLIIASFLLCSLPGLVAGDLALIACIANDDLIVASCWGQYFKPPYDIEPSKIMLYLKKYASDPSEDLCLYLYATTWANNRWEFTGEPLASHLHIDTTEWDSDWNWIEFSMPDGILLESTVTYALYQHCEDDSKVVWGWYSGGCLDDAGRGNCVSEGDEIVGILDSYSTDMNFIVYGTWGYTSAVSTLPAYFDNEGTLHMPGMVHSLGTDNSAAVYIDYGVTEDVVDTKECGYVDEVGKEGMFEAKLYGVPGGVTLYYQARMIGVQSGTEREGEIESIYCPGQDASLEVEVIENSPERVRFEVFVEDLGACDSVTLNLSAATTYCSLMAGGTINMVVDSGVELPGSYFLDDSTEFEEGTTYYYRALMIYEGDVVAASEHHIFTRYDTSKPGIVNMIVGGLDKWGLGGGIGGTMNIEWFWWGLVFLALALIWLLASRAKNKKFGAFIGIFGSIIVLGFVVAYGLVDIWLVALLSIIAGAAIYLFIVRKILKGREA